MYRLRIVFGVVLFAGLIPTLAHADLTFIGRQDAKGQGFGSVINVLTLQKDTSESGSVAWNGTGDVITGTTSGGCPSGVTCLGPDTGASNNAGKTGTQTFGTVGWQNAASIVVSLNINQQGSNQDIKLESLTMNVYDTNGNVLFTAPLDTTHIFTTIEQGTGSGYFIFQLNAAEQATAQSALFGANFNANNRVGVSALLDSTSNDGAETIGVVNGNVVPEPGFYGTLALGLTGLLYGVQRSRRKTSV
jgi:hypothetical protein